MRASILTLAFVLALVLNVGAFSPLGSDARADTPTTIYVAPWGSDTNPGTFTQPFQTLRFAQTYVRTANQNMTGDLEVYLEQGTYRLSSPLDFEPQDSGTNGYTITWTGPTSGSAVISGAQRVFGWKQSKPHSPIWEAHVPPAFNTRQLYVNGSRAWLDFGPPPTKLANQWEGYKASSTVMDHWRNPTDIDFVYRSQLGDHVEPICPVGSITDEIITMANPCWSNSDDRFQSPNLVGFGRLGTPTYIENAFELLKQPGEFYLDRSAHVLYYMPRKGEDMHTAIVEAPLLQTLISGKGTQDSPVHNVTFSNLQFSYATWLQPGTPEGFSEVQSGYTLTGQNAYKTEGLCNLVRHGTCPYGAWTKEPGNVHFSYDQDISFVNDRFVHLGAAALNLDNGSQADLVEGCVFTDVSGNGLEIGNVNLPWARGSSQTSNITVQDNHIYGIPVEYQGGADILAGYASNLTIIHNQIDHTPYAPISMGWGGWLDKIMKPSVANYSHDNLVAENRIYDFMEILADGGGVYTQGLTGKTLADGEKVTGNVVYNQLDWGSALKSDDGAANVTYSGNVLYNDTYDWAGAHYDYQPISKTTPSPCKSKSAEPSNRHHVIKGASKCMFDPELVSGNWWQQGDPNYNGPGITELGNKIIDGPSDAPQTVLTEAGIEASHSVALHWQPWGEAAPGAPSHVSTVYAQNGQAYITWHPSYVEGSSPVTSYLVSVCLSRWASTALCQDHAVQRRTFSASELDQVGYCVVSGLSEKDAYAATVTALNSDGSSPAAVPSPTFTPRAGKFPIAWRPQHIRVREQSGRVTVIWYRPKNDKGIRDLLEPGGSRAERTSPSQLNAVILSYVITVSDGEKIPVGGHEQLISTNGGGRIEYVVSGLSPKTKYRFWVAGVTPYGTGLAGKSVWITPK